jgi:hypothetical protein
LRDFFAARAGFAGAFAGRRTPAFPALFAAIGFGFGRTLRMILAMMRVY